MPPASVRPARPADVPSLLEMKRRLVIEEDAELALRATEQEWLRDAFGPQPRFAAFVAESNGAVVGMVTVSERYYTSLAGSTLYIQDIFVEPRQRGRGIASLLLTQVGTYAVERGNLLVELTVREDSPARRLYQRRGFTRVPCGHYVTGAAALAELAIAVEGRAAAKVA